MPNPPIPALIIGLGGSGAVTVMHVKQQLYNTYHNQMPETVGLLVLDTSQNPLIQFADGGHKREQGMGFGQITFDPREYGHLGGDAYDAITSLQVQNNGNFEHIGSWFQSDEYLRTLHRHMFHLQNGAGQYRQFGRLALFMDLSAPNTSHFYTLVNERLSALKRQVGGDKQLPVFIIGSLAGGTGAGLFLDVAYLVRQLAEAQNMQVLLRGYFYLPEAFAATVPASDRDEARSRTFAALRELSRFMLHEAYELGYPMYYQNSRFTSQKGIWRGRLHSKLYDLVYLVDGQREENPIPDYPLEQGVTPSIADAILALIDSQAGEYQKSYIVNIANQVHLRQRQEGMLPYVGTLGTYTMILPIQQIIESWAYQLGKEVLDTLLTPARYDETTRLPLELASDENEERKHKTDDEVRQFLSRDAIVDPRDPQRRIYPTALWPQLFRWHNERITNETAAARHLAGNDADWWMNVLKPTSADRGPEAVRAIQLIDATMAKNVTNEVQLSQAMRLDPTEDYSRVIRETEKLFNNQLGMVKASGQREGGTFRTALNELTQLQVNRFRQALEVYTLVQLNGRDENEPHLARKGKLGWTMAVYRDLEEVFNDVLKLLERARTENRGGATAREMTLRDWEDAARDLREVALTRHKNKTAKAQERYRDAAEQVLNMYRAEAAREAVEATVHQMKSYLRTAIAQLRRWIEVLALHYQSLYAAVHKGEQQVLSELDNAEDYPSRKVIRDQAWEQSRYEVYSHGALNTALRGASWNACEETDEVGRTRLRIVFTLDGQPLRDDGRGEWSRHNADLLMTFCRDIFVPARERESVLNYLSEYAYKDASGAEKLAGELFENSGALLGFDKAFVGGFVRRLYLLVHQNQSSAEGQLFLKNVTSGLRGLYKFGANDQSVIHLQNSDDPFRLTLASMAELLPLNRIRAYDRYAGPYMNKASSIRPQLHIFPAEVRAVQYEDQLTRLNQSRRMISNRVLVLLEDIKRFREFLMLMAHHIIVEERDYLDQRDVNYVYFLLTPAKEHPEDDQAVDEWWLTKPSVEPSLLEAMTTYIFREEDYGRRVHQEDYRFRIDYEHVTQYLLNVRQYDTDQRVAAGIEENLGIFKPEMRRWLAKYEPGTPRYNALTRIIVEYDILQELKTWMQDEQLPLIQERLKDISRTAPDQQAVDRTAYEAAVDLYDLYSVAILVLQEMIDTKHKDARKTAEELR
ncbi:MAG: hypothetical protein IT324_34250 [Anaerolineae bacterium]|nr:hypothetical protein [Anaerolineae bacterium]